jgi:hypothetical protein
MSGQNEFHWLVTEEITKNSPEKHFGQNGRKNHGISVKRYSNKKIRETSPGFFLQRK